MNVITQSGSMYHCILEGTRLVVQKPGGKPSRAIAVFPDRVPALEATTRWRHEGKVLLGFNAKGSRTCRLVTDQVLEGMIFWSPNGLRSTPIKEVYGKPGVTETRRT
jgi:hypothetical protein